MRGLLTSYCVDGLRTPRDPTHDTVLRAPINYQRVVTPRLIQSVVGWARMEGSCEEHFATPLQLVFQLPMFPIIVGDLSLAGPLLTDYWYNGELECPEYLVFLALSEWNVQVMDMALAAAAKVNVRRLMNANKCLSFTIVRKPLKQFSAARIIPGLVWLTERGDLLLTIRPQTELELDVMEAFGDLLEGVTLHECFAIWNRPEPLDQAARHYAHTSGGIDTASTLLRRLAKDRSALVARLSDRSKFTTQESRFVRRRAPQYVLSLAVLLAWSCPHPPDPKLLTDVDDEHRGYTGSDYQVYGQLLMLRADRSGALVRATLVEIRPALHVDILEAFVYSLSSVHFGSRASRRAPISTDQTLSFTQCREWVRLYELCMMSIDSDALLFTKAPKRLMSALEQVVSFATRTPNERPTALAKIVARDMHPALVADLTYWRYARAWVWELCISVDDPKGRRSATAAAGQLARLARHGHREEARELLKVLPAEVRRALRVVGVLSVMQ
ncbi:hypothetical protein BC828DRAFT_440590 [Blastocladiella britannica]|nr:hypothetical protein BC828DRAFT_440590 [Blastocladiella britannica]